MTDTLLQPFSTARLTFKNRMVHAPTTMNMSDERGYATRQAVGAYESLAAGGFGAVCVGRDLRALGWADQRADAWLLR